MNSLPLKGVKVAALTSFAAAPAAARILGDWGADVIKVESLEGDFSRWSNGGLGIPIVDGVGESFEYLNANTRALSVDLKSEAGKEIMYKLLAECNVFLTAVRPKALKKLGLDYEALHEKFPHLIWALVSSYGEKGPLVDAPGYDSVAYWGRSGATIDFAEKDTSPLVTPMGIGDNNVGAVLAGGIAAALYHQQKTGEGNKVIISLYGTMIWNMSGYVMSQQYDYDKFPKSRKNTNPFVNCYKCADGEWMFIIFLQYERWYEKVCKALGCEELIGDPRFATQYDAIDNAEAMIAVFDKCFAKHPVAEWEEILSAADLPHQRLNHIRDILTDEQAKANSYIYKHKCRTTGNEVWMPAPPIQLGDDFVPVHGDAPKLGEQTVTIMRELGYTDSQIENSLSNKVVFQWEDKK